MELISSDTNVWIDFAVISKLSLPFKLPYQYLMFEEAVREELRSPKDLREKLIDLGLQAVSLTLEEFMLAGEYSSKYIKLSIYDSTALAIAKSRNIALLTGDNALRKAAQREGVKFFGTLGILDKLQDGKYIETIEYVSCLEGFSELNGKEVRLPGTEIQKRLEQCKLES